MFRRYYSVEVTNPFQEEVAALAAKGHVGAIVTTNYDRCLEVALQKAGAAAQAVVGPRDVMPPGKIPVFKIHGSVERADQPLVLNLRAGPEES